MDRAVTPLPRNPDWLGVVLAGGRSRRFGSDKAVALLHGRTLIDHAIDALAAHCVQVVIAGRAVAGFATLADEPAPGLGPLGGLLAALSLAARDGRAAVLSCGVDSGGLPAGIVTALPPAPAFLAEQPIVGLWPVSAAPLLRAYLATDPRRSVRGFATAIGARAVPGGLPNINTPVDLARLAGEA